MPPKKIKPPIHRETSPSKSKPLTNIDYDEIFDAVINNKPEPEPSKQNFPNFKSPLVGKSPEKGAFSPKECASLENSQNTSSQKQNIMKKEKTRKISRSRKSTAELVVSLNKPKQVYSESSNNQSESISTIHSEDFRKNAVFSTPVIKEPSTIIKKKQKSFREAVKNLKDSESQLSETLLGSLSQAQTSLNNSLLTEAPLSQPPANLNHRERLLWLKARRGENVFVQCDRCDKWRLSDVQDPVDLPDKWYCYMNKDKSFNNCSVPEQKLSIYVEADLIMNQYTAGTLVWAKIYNYPWWPAMVDDDPDTEQYYWIEDYDLNIPTHYHVTFFDGKREKTTRAWINASNLKSFKHNLDLDKNVSIKYKARMRFAKEQAIDAIILPIKERLNKYCFISKTRQRINTPISTPDQSDTEDETYKSRNSKTRKINKRRYTVDDPVAQLRKLFLQGSKKETQAVDKKQEITKKVTKRRKTFGDTNELLQKKEKSIKNQSNVFNKIDKTRGKKNNLSDIFSKRNIDESKKSLNVENSDKCKSNSQNENKEQKNQQRRNSIPEKCSQRDSSQDSNEPKKITRRRNTRIDTSTERDNSFSQDSSRQKRITKRRSTIAVYEARTLKNSQNTVIENSNKVEKYQEEKKAPRRRKSILERYLQRDSSQELDEPKKITRRRNTRANTSIEPDSSFSQGSSKGQKITKRRKTIADYQLQTSKESQNTVIEQNSTKLKEDEKEKRAPRRRKSILVKYSQRDSSEDLNEPKKITTRRSTRGNTSMDQTFSQDSNKEKRISKRRSTISVYESQNSKNSQNTVIEQESIKLEKDQKEKLTPRRRNSITCGYSRIERDNSFFQDSNKDKKATKCTTTIDEYEPSTLRDSQKSIENSNKINKIQRRRVSIPEKNNSQNSDRSKNDNKLGLNTSIERECSFSEGSTRYNRTTLGQHDSQNSETSKKTAKCISSNKLQIKKERDNSQNSNVSTKISTRRNTLSSLGSQENETNSQNENKENKIKRRRNTIRETNSQRSSSQNSDDESQKNSKHKNIRLESNIEKENTSSQGSQKEKKITKRRTTIAEYNYKLFNEEETQKTNMNTRNMQENKITRRRNTIEKDASFTDSSIRSDSSTKTNKQRSKFVCPIITTNSSLAVEENRFNESQSEPTKYRKTLGARKIFSSNPPKNTKGTESGYESAISTKREEEKKQNLSTILEESKLDISTKSSYKKIEKYHIPKKRRQTTDGQEKKNDSNDDEELEISFTSLSHSLEQLDVEKRKKKFMAICKEIVNVDKDPTDPTISEKEKIFYEKLNSSLKEMEEKQDHSSDENLLKKVQTFENKLNEIENNNYKSPFKSITTSSVTSVNTSMHSDFSDVGTKTMKKSSNKRSSSLDSVDSLPFEI